jgi:Fe-S-cluster-containing dehydrogenase component/DMSO reductase anchor subunit
VIKLDGGISGALLETPGAMLVDKVESQTLIGQLLLAQADLSAVERFAQYHDDAQAPRQGRYYSALIPATPPGPGQQYGFEVELDRCSGCKACVSACHSLNGLDEGETWRDVGMLVGGDFSLPVIQHVTSACHHCLEPACLTACPVDAYEKDPITGIVRHLDDQCVGCQYCTLACPYDVPKFHSGKGIVRKCDMCSDRLAAGEAPACVQACPHEAIRIRVVDHSELVDRAARDEFLACSPSPTITLPSTIYRSASPLDASELRPGDEHKLTPEHAHAPLIVMLVLTQLSVGGFLVELLARLAGTKIQGLSVLCLAFGTIGLTSSLFHLGRPFYAYRAFLGIRHSWLSREIAAFSLFANFAQAYVALQFFQPEGRFGLPLLWATVGTGILGVFTSVMVYHAVKRPFWSYKICGVKFAGTALILGVATAFCCVSFAYSRGGLNGRAVVAAASLLIVFTSTKLLFEARIKQRWLDGDDRVLRKSALLMSGPLRQATGLRAFHAIIGGQLLPVLAIVAVSGQDRGLVVLAASISLAALLIAEFVERYLFFTAVAKPSMPRGY